MIMGFNNYNETIMTEHRALVLEVRLSKMLTPKHLWKVCEAKGDANGKWKKKVKKTFWRKLENSQRKSSEISIFDNVCSF